MIARSVDRVVENTCATVNEQIRRKMQDNIDRCAAGGREAIDRRLGELDVEWDIERVLETLAPSVTLTGLCLGLTLNRKWLLLPVLVNAFLVQHAIQGWCPPLPLLRRLGVRTAEEIDQERYSLKALRGDFSASPLIGRGEQGIASQVLAAVRR